MPSEDLVWIILVKVEKYQKEMLLLWKHTIQIQGEEAAESALGNSIVISIK